MNPDDSTIQITSIIEDSRVSFLRSIMYIGTFGTLLTVTVLIVLQIGDPKILDNTAVFIVGVILYFALRVGKKILPIIYVFATIIALIGFLIMIFSADIGITKNAVTYVSLFPMFAIFFQGKKWGIIWTIGYTVVLLFLLFLHQDQIAIFSNVVFSSIFSILLVTYTVYSFQNTAEKAQTLLSERAVELSDEIKTREEVQVQLKATIEQLATQKKEVERVNALMVGRELAMADLKKKLESLQPK